MPKSYDINQILTEPANGFAEILHKKLIDADLVSPGEKIVYHANSWDWDINSDGFDGWFLNANAQELRDALATFISIGAHKRAELLKQAMSIFPDSNPPDDPKLYNKFVYPLKPEQKKFLGDLFSTFTELAYNDEEDLSELIRKYVISHIEDFR